MRSQTSQKAELFARALSAIGLGVFAVFVCAAFALSVTLLQPRTTAAATSSTINFQARLETNTGAIAPDGNYNVTFHLFSSSTAVGGTSTDTGCGTDTSCEWVEQYTYNSGAGSTDARVRVVNGYLTVNLGSVNAFSGINWNQQQWLTMDIGGTVGSGTITWDGQMSPRLLMTASPYAFQAGGLSVTSGSYTDSVVMTTPTSASHTITVPDETGTVCTTAGSAACTSVYAPASGGAGGYIQNGVTTQAANFNIQGSSSTAPVAVIQANNGGSGDILELKNGSGTIVASLTNTGSVLFKPSTSSTTALQVQGSGTVFNVDTTNGRVGVGTASPQNALTVIGDYDIENSTTPTKGYRFRTSGGALDWEASGAQLYISTWSGANFTGTQYNQFVLDNGGGNINVQRTMFPGTNNTFDLGVASSNVWSHVYSANIITTSVDAASSGGTLNVGTSSAGTIQVGNTSGTTTTTIQGGTGNINLVTNSASASIIAKSSTNSTTAFRVQNSSNANVLNVDTVNNAIVLGNDGTPSALTVRGGTAAGTDIQGSNITFDASNGTGSGGSGDLIFRTAGSGASGSITQDAVSTAHPGNGVTSISWSHTVGSSSNRLLIVGVTASSAGASSVTYGGVNLTKLGSITGSSVYSEIWYLKNPTSGTATVAVNFSSSNTAVAGSISYSNVNQTTTFGTPSTATGNSLIATNSISSTNANQLVF